MPRASPAAHHSQCDDLVVVGAHQDSTNLLPFLPAPGADDDGSGTTTSLEALTLLVQSGFRPANSSVEFHWYSAEEGGMLGSQALTSQYQKDGKRVKAMLQMDMVSVKGCTGHKRCVRLTKGACVSRLPTSSRGPRSAWAVSGLDQHQVLQPRHY